MSLSRGVSIAVAVVVSSFFAFGQAPTGVIRLEVKDPSGSAMQVSGSLDNLATGQVRRFQTDTRGASTLASLPFGRYRLQVSKTGFADQSQTVDVSTASPISITITMAIGTAVSKIDVVSTTPLAGADLSVQEISAPVQTALELDIEHSGALDLSDFLNRRLDAVHVNEMQGNPFQSDVNYRGYTASPLLGTPQGLSVYMDGVRLNQPFGDVVSWDLIPRNAIEEIALMPGSNPVFGLNTLGGALSIQTKNGLSQPGTTIQIGYGSYNRKTLEFEHGGSRGALNWYIAGNGFTERGWRNNPSDVRQLFTKTGWQNATTVLSLTAAYANNALNGNGLQEQRFLARDYTSVYTTPDLTDNRSPFLNFTARRIVNSKWTLSGNAYYRYIYTKTFNGDLNENSLDQSLYQPGAAERAALAAAGYTGVPISGATAANTPFPFWRCIGNALIRDEPAEKCNGLLNSGRGTQHNYGVSGQASWFTSPGGHRNQFTAGAGYDGSRINFRQSTELGYLNSARAVIPVGVFGDGVTGGSVDGAPYDVRVNLNGRPHTGSVYATDTFWLGSKWNFTLSGRYNRSTIDNFDRIQPDAGPGSLTSHSVFQRFNPAAGVTYNLSSVLNAYFGYNEGSRAPTSIELGCADPNEPCKLPNAIAGDPPLDQVVTRTVEAGIRGGQEASFHWNIGWFRGENHHDILFVASNQTGFGYFKNFGQTRRQGLEVDLSHRIWRATVGGGYTFLDATYQSAESVDGSSNSTNDAAAKGLDGAIHIQPGARIPLVPRHMLKAYLDLQATKKLSVDLGLMALSSSYARGNENNLHQPDGIYYLGSGRSPGYALLNLGARYSVTRRLQAFLEVSNLADRHYYSAAQLGPTGFTDSGNFIARPLPAVNGEFPVVHATFYAPGAPRLAWGGLRFSF